MATYSVFTVTPTWHTLSCGQHFAVFWLAHGWLALAAKLLLQTVTKKVTLQCATRRGFCEICSLLLEAFRFTLRVTCNSRLASRLHRTTKSDQNSRSCTKTWLRNNCQKMFVATDELPAVQTASESTVARVQKLSSLTNLLRVKLNSHSSRLQREFSLSSILLSWP